MVGALEKKKCPTEKGTRCFEPETKGQKVRMTWTKPPFSVMESKAGVLQKGGRR